MKNCTGSRYAVSQNQDTLKVKDWITSRNSIRRIHGIGYTVSRAWEDRVDKIEITNRVVSQQALLFTEKSLS
ncbi:hypothetical protein Tco_0923227 [Tanacetum coccineum]|uniref:Uncharacterized protein n=1 Tax=Tanacetum coccineum TaxID=301880 RepID=A0ABQ5D2T7_9ASTR